MSEIPPKSGDEYGRHQDWQSSIMTILTPSPSSLPPRSWPPFTPLARGNFPTHSLLAGTEALVWQALGYCLAHRGTTLNLRGKQVVIRQALQHLGLGWVATNTTPFRIAVGKLYDQAAQALADSSSRRQESFENDTLPTTPARKRPKVSSALPSITVQTTILPSTEIVPGPLVDEKFQPTLKVTVSQRTALWQDLYAHGAVVIRQAVPPTTLTDFLVPSPSFATLSSPVKSTALRETMGNGVAGTPPSRYFDLPKPSDTYAAQLSVILGRMLIDEEDEDGKTKDPLALLLTKRKSIFLAYGEGAENWAHQDYYRGDGLPVQAVLLTSQPNIDFTGGEFYVARRRTTTTEPSVQACDDDATSTTSCTTLCIERNVIEWENAGDLVVFLSSKEWWHGMKRVRSTKVDSSYSPEGKYLRQAIGLLQPC